MLAAIARAVRLAPVVAVHAPREPLAVQIATRTHREDQSQRLRGVGTRLEIAGTAAGISHEYFHGADGDRVYFSSEVVLRFDGRSAQVVGVGEGDSPLRTFARIVSELPAPYRAVRVASQGQVVAFEIVRRPAPRLQADVLGPSGIRLRAVGADREARWPVLPMDLVSFRGAVERALDQAKGDPAEAFRILHREVPSARLVNQASDGSVLVTLR